jgi:hypothetical protein
VSEPSRQRVLLSVQRALVGTVGPSLLGASVEWTARAIGLTWYVANTLSDDEREDLIAAGGMVAGDFSAEVELSEEFVEIEGTTRPTPAGAWVFLRRELV